jgi:hypothetical protein
MELAHPETKLTHLLKLTELAHQETRPTHLHQQTELDHPETKLTHLLKLTELVHQEIKPLFLLRTLDLQVDLTAQLLLPQPFLTLFLPSSSREEPYLEFTTSPQTRQTSQASQQTHFLSKPTSTTQCLCHHLPRSTTSTLS